MKLTIAMTLVAATTAGSVTYETADVTSKYASIKTMKQDCEIVRNGVLVKDDVRKAYFCRVAQGTYTQMTGEK